jgi:hypothetical protein
VARQVEVVEALMAAARDAGDADEVSYLRTKEVALRSKEAVLRKEKADMREEQLLLLRSQSGACPLSVFVCVRHARGVDSPVRSASGGDSGQAGVERHGPAAVQHAFLCRVLSERIIDATTANCAAAHVVWA